MKALIVDVIPDGECEVTRKAGVECYRVRLDGGEESTMTPAELLKMLRYRKAQELKVAATPKAGVDK